MHQFWRKSKEPTIFRTTISTYLPLCTEISDDTIFPFGNYTIKLSIPNRKFMAGNPVKSQLS
jgi:hypothetical protein